MRLVDLDPMFLDGHSGGRAGVGIEFSCPCGKCGIDCYIPFENPLDGGPPYDKRPNLPHWKRTGDTFETLTLSPSILRSVAKGGCGWHGWIRNGEVLTA